jgi:eukaryotic-like serine/threonine-protein kinase
VGSTVARQSDHVVQGRIGSGKEPPGRAVGIVAFAEMGLEGSDSSRGYVGRSHSLWYCDAEEEGRFGWYELAFMQTLGGPAGFTPFSLSPDQGAAAIAPGMATVQLARNLRRLLPGQLDEFVEMWGGLMAAAAQGPLTHPNSLPEEQIVHNWRGR